MKYIAFLAVLIAALTLSPPAAAATDWTWPVRGDVVTPYKNGDDPYASGQHRGIDIAAPVGTRVVAAVGGRVTYAGVAGSSGLTVSVRTADGRYDTSYLHLSAATVKEGDTVDRGQTLGAVGTSGTRSADDPHLHFGVRETGDRHAYRDPLDFLPPLGGPAPDVPPSAVPVGSPDPVSAPPPPASVLSRVPDVLASTDAPPVGAALAGLAAPTPAGSPGDSSSLAPAMPASTTAVSPRSAASASPTQSVSSSPAAPTAPPRAASSSPAAPARAASPVDGPGTHRVTRADLASPRTGTDAKSADTHSRLAVAGRSAAAPRPGDGGLNVGWLTAVIGLVVAATCLGHPQAARQATRRSRAALGAALRPLVPRPGGGSDHAPASSTRPRRLEARR
jgi:pyruvate/2-oxoglutarate dehydrogenase complex dihydrolipoamide acyltransferase (E2) component